MIKLVILLVTPLILTALSFLGVRRQIKKEQVILDQISVRSRAETIRIKELTEEGNSNSRKNIRKAD